MRFYWIGLAAVGVVNILSESVLATEKDVLADVGASLLEKDIQKGIHIEEEQEEERESSVLSILSEEEGSVLFTDEDLEEKDISFMREKIKLPFIVSKDREVAKENTIPFPGLYYKSKHGVYKHSVTGRGEALAQEVNLLQTIASIPLFGEIKQENYLAYEGTGLVTAYLISKSSDIEDFRWMEEVAEPLKEKIKVALLDFTSTKFFLESAGIREEMTPCFLIIVEKDKKIHKYKSSTITKIADKKEFAASGKNLAKGFFEEYLSGKLETFLMNEIVPEEEKENSSGVKKVSNFTFKEFAMDILKDSLIVYHVEWCRYCQSFMPELDKLSRELKSAGVDAISFGKMLMSKNDLPLDVEVKQIQAYPSIRLYKKGTNEEIEYENGEKPADAFLVLNFLKKHCDIPEAFSLEEKKEEAVPEIKQDL